MEQSRGERIARRWLRRRQKAWIAAILAASAVVFAVLTPMGDNLLEVAYRAAMTAMCGLAAVISFERRQFGEIIDRLEAENAELRSSSAG